jgi:sugar transferase (PEP-CTERM system associated)
MPSFLNKYYSPRKVFFFYGEGLLIFLALLGVYYISKGTDLFANNILLYSSRALFITITFQLSLYFFDLYDLNELLAPHDIIIRVLQAFGVGCIVLAICYYLIPILMIPNAIFLPGFGAACLSVFTWRFIYNHILRRKLFVKTIIIVGTGKIACDICHEIEQKMDRGFKIAHFIGKRNPTYPLPTTIPMTSNVNQLSDLCRSHNIEQVVVAIDDRRGQTPIKQLMECKFHGFPIENGIQFFERLTGKILVENINPAWIIFSEGFKKSRIQTLIKLLLDTLLALFGLVVTLPITLLSCIIIRFESPGPIFYLQERVGLNGKTFNVIKFRSMRNDAEKHGPVWAQKNDVRMTRYGAFIRKVRIDELPQMINVLKGEMSFVGPRPERPVFVDQLVEKIPYYAIRHHVKPGITGWAQICYPYGDSEDDALRKLEYDIYYLKFMSLQFDLSIIFQTAKTVLFGKGSR